jgi:hypothetical protein
MCVKIISYFTSSPNILFPLRHFNKILKILFHTLNSKAPDVYPFLIDIILDDKQQPYNATLQKFSLFGIKKSSGFLLRMKANLPGLVVLLPSCKWGDKEVEVTSCLTSLIFACVCPGKSGVESN